MHPRSSPFRFIARCRYKGIAYWCLAGALNLATSLASASDVWKPIGPYLATAFAYARDPFDEQRLLIGTFFSGVYLSEDGGSTWRSIAPEFSSAFVQDLAADSANEGVFYAATFERGIFKTTDNGESWTAKNDGLASGSIRGLSVSPLNPNLLLSCSFAGPYYSVDGGDYWLPSEQGSLPCISAVHSESIASVAYLGTDGLGVYRSIDGGVNWEAWNHGMENAVVFDIILDPLVAEVLYAATDKGVFTRGANDGAWTSIKFNLPDANVDQIVFHPDGRLLASSGVGVFSYNRADPETWYEWSDRPARFVIPFPEVPGKFILAGFEDTLEMTLDDGETMTPSVEGVQNNFPDALAAMEYDDSVVVLAGLDSGVWRSDESISRDTRRWTQAESIKEHLIFELATHPTREGHVYAGTERAGVWFSEDAGATWTQRSEGIYPRVIHDLAQSKFGEQTAYCATEVGIFISRDDGRTWKMGTNVAVPSLITAVEADAVKEGFAYYGTANGEIFFTSNDRDFAPGRALPNGIKTIRSVPFEGVYVVTFDGKIYSSRDDTLQMDPRPNGLEHPVLDVAVDPQQTEIAYVATAGGGVYKTVSEGSQWESSNAGIASEFIFALALDPNNRARLYAAGQGVVFVSEDSAASWSPSSEGLPPGRNVSRLVVSATESGVVFCSVENFGVYRSDDYGATWSSLLLDESEATGNLPLLLSTTMPGELFVGSKGLGVQRWHSDDGWSRSGTGITDLVRGIAIGREKPDLMFAASLNSGIFRSVDAGLSWTRAGLAEHRLLHVEMNPKNDSEVFAGTTIGPAVSRDSGENWELLGQKVAYVQALTTFNDSSEHIALGGASGLMFYSENGGSSWRSIHPSLPSNEITALTSGGASALFAGIDSAGLYVTHHPAEPWRLISDTRFQQDRIVAVEADPIYQQVFVASLLGGLYLTNFGGDSWMQLPIPIHDFAASPITALARDPLAPDRLFVCRANPEMVSPSVFISEDRGNSWASAGPAEGLPAGNAYWVQPSPLVADVVLCGTDDGVYRSIDGGREWDSTGLRGLEIDRIAFDRVDKNTVYAASLGIAMFISRDRGLSWNAVAWDPKHLVSRIVPGDEAGHLTVSTYENGVFFTRDFGATWTGGVTPELSRVPTSYVAIDPVTPSTVYFATSQQGVLRTFDGGRTLEQVNEGLGSHLTTLTLLVDPQDPYTLYVGTVTDGVYTSENRGDSWKPIREGMPHELTISLTANPMNSRTLYAGVEGGGVYKIERDAKHLDPMVDHDLDGLPTIWEQYLNLDPLERNASFWREFSASAIEQENDLVVYKWYRGIDDPGQPVSVRLQWSDDLRAWTDYNLELAQSETILVDESTSLIQNTLKINVPDGSSAVFVRLQLSR